MACTNAYVPEAGKRYMCRKCEHCRKVWKQRWTGRLMCEHASSRSTWFVTLTIGGGYDNPEAYALDSSWLHKWNQAMKRQGHQFRYVAVAEYGGDRGRGHWHLILFWKSEPPVVPMGKRFRWTFTDKRGIERDLWPHGLVQCEYPRSNQAAMSYVLGYLDKGKGHKGEFTFSKRPAVGESYLLERARKAARVGLALFPKGTPTYQVEGNVKDRGPTAGQLYDYWLDTDSAVFDRMISAYLVEWFQVRPGSVLPWCRWVEAYVRALDADDRDQLVAEPIRLHHAAMDKMLRLRVTSGARMEFQPLDEPGFYALRAVDTGTVEVRYYDDQEGEWTWRDARGRGEAAWQSLLGERFDPPPPSVLFKGYRGRSGSSWSPPDIGRGQIKTSRRPETRSPPSDADVRREQRAGQRRFDGRRHRRLE